MSDLFDWGTDWVREMEEREAEARRAAEEAEATVLVWVYPPAVAPYTTLVKRKHLDENGTALVDGEILRYERFEKTT